ncbi:MAG: Rieske (2Fe-2S) protein [Calditrichaeota bacterium]|nr:Rieske (2Fe-2S) protein [Calditrichota bacterium]
MSFTEKQIAISSRIKEGKGFSVVVDGKKIVVFRYKGELFALRNSCPHQGALLSDGFAQNEQAVCLYHGWRFNLKDGAFDNNPILKIPTYAVYEKDGFVFLKIPDDFLTGDV